MLRPVWCNNGGTKSSACRSCIVVYSRVMIFWFSNTVYFCMIGLNLFSIGAGNCAMQLFGRDLIVKHVSPHACPKFSRQTLPDNSISSDLSKKDAIRAESLSCRPSSPPLVCLAKRCKREKKGSMMIQCWSHWAQTHGSTVTNWIEKDAARQQQTTKVYWRKVVIVHRLTLD